MRTKLFTILAGLLVACLLGFTAQHYDLRKSTAEADQSQGLFIFHQAKPASDFETLGTVKVGGVMGSTKFESCKESLMKKAKKEYPKAEGIIIEADGFAADVIRFK